MGCGLVRRFLFAPTVAPLRRRTPLAALALTAYSLRKRRYLPAAAAATVAGVGYAYRYKLSRVAARSAHAEQVERMRRLGGGVPETGAAPAIMVGLAPEDELPRYDKNMLERRRQNLGKVAAAQIPASGRVVEIGSTPSVLRGPFGSDGQFKTIPARLTADGIWRDATDTSRVAEGVADVVICSEALERVVDAYGALSDISRTTRYGGVVVVLARNASAMPDISPLRDPGSWIERLVGRWRPGVLCYRHLTAPAPIGVDAAARDAVYAPDVHLTYADLRDLSRDAGLDVVSATTIQFPDPNSRAAQWLRWLTTNAPVASRLATGALEATAGLLPAISLLGAYHIVVLSKARPARIRPLQPWWPAGVAKGLPLDYMTTREDIADLVPAGARTVLDVGCSAGALGLLLRERGARVTGIELDERRARMAEEVLDAVVCGDAVEVLASGRGLDGDGYDCIVMSDCLEHLTEPHAALKNAVHRLEPRGCVVISLPNVRHWETFWSVGVRGVWPNREVGIFDRTHLHFFTRRTAEEMMRSAGLTVERAAPVRRVIEQRPSVLDIAARMIPKDRVEFLTFQWLLVGRRAATPQAPPSAREQ